jgi:hypothetical protein
VPAACSWPARRRSIDAVAVVSNTPAIWQGRRRTTPRPGDYPPTRSGDYQRCSGSDRAGAIISQTTTRGEVGGPRDQRRAPPHSGLGARPRRTSAAHHAHALERQPAIDTATGGPSGGGPARRAAAAGLACDIGPYEATSKTPTPTPSRHRRMRTPAPTRTPTRRTPCRPCRRPVVVLPPALWLPWELSDGSLEPVVTANFTKAESAHGHSLIFITGSIDRSSGGAALPLECPLLGRHNANASDTRGHGCAQAPCGSFASATPATERPVCGG